MSTTRKKRESETGDIIPKPEDKDSESKRGKTEDEKLNEWLSQLYDPRLITDEELKEFYENYQYKGFDRSDVIIKLKRIAPDPKIASQIIIICVLRGPVAASKTKLLTGQTLQEIGLKASGGKGTKEINCARISSALADIAAFHLKRMKAPKRLSSSELPGWLQFPSAGSIKLPEVLRRQHLEFSKQFSRLIGGEFNESIYTQMINNSYLDDRLRLFE